MPNKKHYIITAITLGAIAMGSAALIGAANLITKNRIEQNEIKKFNEGITAIFGENSSSSPFSLDINDHYLVSSYHVDKNEETYGWAVRTTGSNMYGKISMLVGFTYESKSFIGIYLISNEQTYATTLVENYVTPLNDGDIGLDDTKCGATYGATLIREMVSEAQDYVNGIIYE